ncbi:ATP-binding protein [Nocardioides taihuensis]|uniref:ATP-binding protein n=1 Tax=Nocardioides taihuensis TaxID=1835606 RepID=A0ABW0BH32_9ACTN
MTETCRARSTDGRTMTLFLTGPGPSLLPGDLVVADDGEESYLAQVVQPPLPASTLEPARPGTGSVIGRIGADLVPHRSDRAPFADAAVSPAGPDHLGALLDARGADLPIGTWSAGDGGVAARVRAAGFNRHSFLCGQSGSGKTYALGVVLEQLLLHTDLRMVVLDPNADFVRLDQPREGADAAQVERVAHMVRHGFRALGAPGNEAGREPMLLRLMTMPRRAQAAVLQLDPILNREEYHSFHQLTSTIRSSEVAEMVVEMAAQGGGAAALAQRLENLGLVDWEVWARDRRSAAETIAEEGGTTVLDLSGFRDPREPLAVTLDVVEHLWTHKEDRTPTLLVIDEAHNLCPPDPEDPLAAAVVRRLVQIAAEGRKYGLWLLLSTQRPSKIHPQVLTQCDNLVLMRMNSPADLGELGTVFGFAPADMVAASPEFVQGEALLAGGFVAVPSLIRMGERLTREGGSDVPVPIARR